MGSVEVTETTAATLKGNHFEVYGQQTTAVNCSRSLLPQGGGGACWWLRRHPEMVTQYRTLCYGAGWPCFSQLKR
jgi:hypothetical protein